MSNLLLAANKSGITNIYGNGGRYGFINPNLLTRTVGSSSSIKLYRGGLTFNNLDMVQNGMWQNIGGVCTRGALFEVLTTTNDFPVTFQNCRMATSVALGDIQVAGYPASTNDGTGIDITSDLLIINGKTGIKFIWLNSTNETCRGEMVKDTQNNRGLIFAATNTIARDGNLTAFNDAAMQIGPGCTFSNLQVVIENFASTYTNNSWFVGSVVTNCQDFYAFSGYMTQQDNTISSVIAGNNIHVTRSGVYVSPAKNVYFTNNILNEVATSTPTWISANASAYQGQGNPTNIVFANNLINSGIAVQANLSIDTFTITNNLYGTTHGDRYFMNIVSGTLITGMKFANNISTTTNTGSYITMQTMDTGTMPLIETNNVLGTLFFGVGDSDTVGTNNYVGYYFGSYHKIRNTVPASKWILDVRPTGSYADIPTNAVITLYNSTAQNLTVYGSPAMTNSYVQAPGTTTNLFWDPTVRNWFGGTNAAPGVAGNGTSYRGTFQGKINF